MRVDSEIANGAEGLTAVFGIANEANGLMAKAILRMWKRNFSVDVKFECTFSRNMKVIARDSNMMPPFNLNMI